ncbi:MAG TPA: PEP-CTERM sorting domain-containing protein, partial [Roseiarcus sp.]
MKTSVVAALGAAMIATLGAESAVRAATIDFGVVGIGGTIVATGSDLEESTALDLDVSTLFVSGIGPGDDSGLAAFDTVSVFAPSPPDTNIIYGFGTGTSPLAPQVVLSWTGSQGAFTETLTTVKEVARNPSSPNSIGVTLLGTVTGPPGSGFIDTPVSLTLTANQEGGPGDTITVSFTNASGVAPSIPEPPTWVMMALGFGAVGYGGFRRR